MQEVKKKRNVVQVGDVFISKEVFSASEVLNEISFIGLYPPNMKVSELPIELQRPIIRFFSDNSATADLTMEKIVAGLVTIAREFDIENDDVRITRDELWLRTINGKGTHGKIVVA